MSQTLSQGCFKENGYITDKNLGHSCQEMGSTEHPVTYTCWPRGINQKHLTHTGYSIIRHASKQRHFAGPPGQRKPCVKDLKVSRSAVKWGNTTAGFSQVSLNI